MKHIYYMKYGHNIYLAYWYIISLKVKHSGGKIYWYIVYMYVTFHQSLTVTLIHYSGPCILRPPIRPAKYGLKKGSFKKYRNVYIENIYKSVSLMAGLKMDGMLKWRGLKWQGPLQ